MRMLNKLFTALLISSILFSCSSDKEVQDDSIVEKKSAFGEVYQYSEMAALMEGMYERLKIDREQVLKGDTLKNYPKDFERIRTAEMTEDFEHNDLFKQFSEVYLNDLHDLYNQEYSQTKRKEQFNTVVNSCLTCHKSDAGCAGPISRISKLLIN